MRKNPPEYLKQIRTRMNVNLASLGHVTLAYQTFGNQNDTAVVLIMGLGAQMIAWPDKLCHALAQKGYFVVRFDNRDIGQSSRFPPKSRVSLLSNALRFRLGLPVYTPYTLHDMARDTVALMDYLNIPEAHLVGASMGGMIAHLVAARYYRRVRSLTSVMSSPGAVGFLPKRTKLLFPLMKPQFRRDPQSQLERKVRWVQALGHESGVTEQERIRERIKIALSRSSDDDEGTRRQAAAIMASGCQLEHLSAIRAPTLVIHGKEDPLIPKERGALTARSIPGARMVLIPGMGHDFPAHLQEHVAEVIAGHLLTTDHKNRHRPQ